MEPSALDFESEANDETDANNGGEGDEDDQSSRTSSADSVDQEEIGHGSADVVDGESDTKVQEQPPQE